MSKDNEDTKREELLRIANLVRPALAAQAYIPALTMVRFDGRSATAFNDISAISVRCALDVKRLLPGELLIRALSSFNAESVLLQETKEGEAVVISSGRSKVKLPTLPLDKFPLVWPDGKAVEIDLTASILQGIKQCLVSVGNDPTHPAQMGVTLDVDKGGWAVLYSTDNYTISRYQTTSHVELPGDSPIILPTFFCEQLVKIAAAFPEAQAALLLRPGSIVAEFGNDLVTLFSKTLVDLEPLDFPRIIDKHVEMKKIEDDLDDIPAGFDAALDRALLVLSQEGDKATRIDTDAERFTMTSTSPMGDATDRFSGVRGTGQSFSVDPAHVARAVKHCAKMSFGSRVLVLADADACFVHLVAHVSGGKS
jgi:DNA polymerase III sliding clamp (beta) subunit (PCNA family)